MMCVTHNLLLTSGCYAETLHRIFCYRFVTFVTISVVWIETLPIDASFSLTRAFTVSLSVCHGSSSPFLGPWGASAWDLGVILINIPKSFIVMIDFSISPLSESPDKFIHGLGYACTYSRAQEFMHVRTRISHCTYMLGCHNAGGGRFRFLKTIQQYC